MKRSVFTKLSMTRSAAALAIALGCQEAGPMPPIGGDVSAGASGNAVTAGNDGSTTAGTSSTAGTTGGISPAGDMSATGGNAPAAGASPSGGVASTGGASAGTSGSAGAAGAGDARVATEANLKIAFVGDTSDGSSWAAVAKLIKSEGAAAVFVAGDMTYHDNPSGWWTATENVLGSDFPVFLARGNHDDATWTGFLPKAATHRGDAVVTPGPHDAAYKQVFRGLSVATIKKGDGGDLIDGFLAGDPHIWRVCLWHQNQTTMQLGDKSDEMGWGPYEACRRAGAFIVTGHEHSYSRTKTLDDTQNQTVDPACSTGAKLCLRPGRTFVNVVGLGGTGARGQVRCAPSAATAPFPSLNAADASCAIWAATYTSAQAAKFGAQFYVFNVDGDPHRATGYFKNIEEDVIDQFELSAD